MCGIVGGVFLKHPNTVLDQDLPKIKEIFSEMLVRAQVRGRDATGVIMVNNDTPAPKVYMLKAPLPAKEFVKTETYLKFINKFSKNTYSLIGHTRASTGGSARNNKNNHPHHCGDIIGVHNGGISNDKYIWNKYSSLTPQGECDSEALFSLINLKYKTVPTMEEAVSDAMDECVGWAAGAFIHLNRPNKVYLFRDAATPMKIGWWNRERMALFASQEDFITQPITNIIGKFSACEVRDLEEYTITALESSYSTVWPVNLDLVLTRFGKKEKRKESEKIIKENKEAFNRTQGDL